MKARWEKRKGLKNPSRSEEIIQTVDAKETAAAPPLSAQKPFSKSDPEIISPRTVPSSPRSPSLKASTSATQLVRTLFSKKLSLPESKPVWNGPGIDWLVDHHPKVLEVILECQNDLAFEHFRVVLPKLLGACKYFDKVLYAYCVHEAKTRKDDRYRMNGTRANQLIRDLFQTSTAVQKFKQDFVTVLREFSEKSIQDEKSLLELINAFVVYLGNIKQIPAEIIVVLRTVRRVHGEPSVEDDEYVKDLITIFIFLYMIPEMIKHNDLSLMKSLTTVLQRIVSGKLKPEDNPEFAAIYTGLLSTSTLLNIQLDKMAKCEMQWMPTESVEDELAVFFMGAMEHLPRRVTALEEKLKFNLPPKEEMEVRECIKAITAFLDDLRPRTENICGK